MSGIEVAGLILGIIPILVKAIEQCQQSYEALDEWVHFRREFFKFSNDVRLQSLLLKQLILRTLASLRQMLSGDEEYETYYGLLQSVHGQLGKVNCGLQKYSRSEPALVERIQFISGQIRLLERFFVNAERLQTSRQRVAGSYIAHIWFERVSRQATSLHRAITRSWKCDCRDSHVFRLIISGSFRPDYSGEGNSTSEENNAVRWCIVEAALATTFELHFSVRNQHLSSGRITINGSSSTMLCQLQPIIVLPSAESPHYHEPLKLAPDSTHLGYLFDGTNSYHALVVVPTGTSSPEIVGQAVSLGHILAGSTSEVIGPTPAPSVALHFSPRAARLKIALMVAHSLLELFPSPWLPGDWDKNDIYFSVRLDGSVNTDMPFLISRNESMSHISRPHDHTKILLSLGILILELWFGQSLESQPSWEANFGPNGKEKEFTKFNAAATWQRMVGDDGGPRLHNITHRCVHGNFGLGTQGLEDAQLIKAVYEKVVMELQHVYDGFVSLERS
ncbi:hypothetical protein B0T13DRAFT_490414 [Neurospora crassa]|nr:hypothetical protein B0T13DRAFT_490414 [Neurospora crassa]